MRNIYSIGGAVQASGGLYLERPADDELYLLCRELKFAYVLTARQMGKSSLIIHTAQRLQADGFRTIIVDLSPFSHDKISAEQWFLTLISQITRNLQL
ncbi:MAG: hypothetical protein KAG66_19145, partial [Methylococcales bacterium]|nr:hypothetical protein [Methylococcales bacterium]